MPREIRDSMRCLHSSVNRRGEHTMYFAKKPGSWKNKCNLAELRLAFSERYDHICRHHRRLRMASYGCGMECVSVSYGVTHQ